MKTIKVLGVGCRNCDATVRLIEERARALGVPVRVARVTDMTELMRHGVAAMPAVVVGGKVVHAGGIPPLETIARLLAVI